MGAIDPHTPIAQGWLRASHRKLDPKLSTPYRPYHTHDRKAAADERRSRRAGRRVVADLDRGPGGLSAGAHACAARDYEWQKSTGARLSNFKNELRGCGPFLHDDPRDRPAAVFGGSTTLHLGDSYVLLPVIPQ